MRHFSTIRSTTHRVKAKTHMTSNSCVSQPQHPSRACAANAPRIKIASLGKSERSRPWSGDLAARASGLAGLVCMHVSLGFRSPQVRPSQPRPLVAWPNVLRYSTYVATGPYRGRAFEQFLMASARGTTPSSGQGLATLLHRRRSHGAWQVSGGMYAWDTEKKHGKQREEAGSEPDH